jgi:hypothetical protein
MQTNLPAAPWTTPSTPDSRAIVTGNGYFLLNLEGLDIEPDDEPATARALRQAVAALPELVAVVERMKGRLESAVTHGRCMAYADAVKGDAGACIADIVAIRAALAKAGAVPPTV